MAILIKDENSFTTKANLLNRATGKVGADLPEPSKSTPDKPDAPLIIIPEKAVAADGTGPNGRDRGGRDERDASTALGQRRQKFERERDAPASRNPRQQQRNSVSSAKVDRSGGFQHG